MIGGRYRRLLPPTIIGGAIFAAQALAVCGLVPPPSAFLESLAKRLESADLLLIGVFSFIEALAILNAYFPGSVVILVAMASTAGDLSRAMLTFTAIAVGSGLAHQIDYWAGKLLLPSPKTGYLTPATTPSLREAFASYWHPHLGSLYSLRSGSDGLSYKQFLSRFSAAFVSWYMFWGILMYNLGRVPVSGSEFLLLFYVYLAWWIIQEFRTIRSAEAVGH